MSDLRTAREVLLAQLIADVDQALIRADTVVKALDEATTRFEAAMLASTEASKRSVGDYIVKRTNEAANEAASQAAGMAAGEATRQLRELIAQAVAEAFAQAPTRPQQRMAAEAPQQSQSTASAYTGFAQTNPTAARARSQPFRGAIAACVGGVFGGLLLAGIGWWLGWLS